jgi:hypothetical protein
MRTILQERVVNIEEKQTKQWNENIDVKSYEQQQKQENRFLHFLNEPSPPIEPPKNLINPDDDEMWPEILNYTTSDPIEETLLDGNNLEPLQPFPSNPSAFIEESLEYSSLFELNLKQVPLTSSTLFEQIHKQPSPSPTIALTKAQKFTITHPDGKANICLWKSENLFEKLRKLFDEKKYDINTFVVIDKNEIVVDFTNTDAQLPHEISLEYFIIEKTLLFQIQFRFRRKLFEYFSTSKSNTSTIINRFITDNDIRLSSTSIYLCFFDEYRKSIDNETIGDLANRMNSLENKLIIITVTEEDNNINSLYEITLRAKQGKQNFTNSIL